MCRGGGESGVEPLGKAWEMRKAVVRRRRVFGTAAKGNFALLVRAVKRGIPLPLAAIRNHRAFLSVENLSSFILQRLSLADRNFDVFLVADQEQVSTPEFMERLAYSAPPPPPVVSPPPPPFNPPPT